MGSGSVGARLGVFNEHIRLRPRRDMARDGPREYRAVLPVSNVTRMNGIRVGLLRLQRLCRFVLHCCCFEFCICFFVFFRVFFWRGCVGFLTAGVPVIILSRKLAVSVIHTCVVYVHFSGRWRTSSA